MLTLITGLPGSYKTTWTLRELCLAGFAGRHKFALGVNGLHVDDLKQLDEAGFKAWESLPAGSVIIADEAQKILPARGMHSGAPPEWIQRLAEHRHGGYDFFLITQHPSFIDAFVRKLVGRHIHLTRRFGREKATVYSWEQCKDPDSETEKKFAVVSSFDPKPDDYARHESATMHTHKLRLPWGKILGLVAAAVVVVGSVAFVIRHLTSGDVAGTGSSRAATEQGPESGSRGSGAGFWSVRSRTARSENLERPESAPLYDPLQVVKSQPRPSGCADFGVPLGGKPSCYCTTQQGSLIREISVHACRALIRGGWFDETRQAVDTGSLQRTRLDGLDAASGGREGTQPGEGGPQAAPPVSPRLSAGTDSP